MGWKTACFGFETPSQSQVITSVVVLTALGLALHGMFVAFVPAAFLYGRTVAIVFLLVGVVEMAVLFAYRIRTETYSAFRDRVGPLKLPLVVIFAPFLLGIGSWLIVGKSLPWMLTTVFGDEYSEPFKMETHYSRKRRFCHHRLKGPPIDRSFPNFLCVGRGFYDRYPEQKVEVMLSGKRSFAGRTLQAGELGDRQ